MSSVRARTVQAKTNTTTTRPFVDSLQYRVGFPVTAPLSPVVIDYTTTPTGYTAVLFNLKIKGKKVYIENTTVYSNEEKTKYFKSGDAVLPITYMRDGNFIDKIERLPEVRVLMANKPVDEFIQGLVFWEKYNLSSAEVLKYGYDNNKFPKHLYPANITNSNYRQVREKILKHLLVKVPKICAPRFEKISTDISSFNEQSMLELQANIKKYTYRMRLYTLCKSMNLELVI
jgi:hypothetical protein